MNIMLKAGWELLMHDGCRYAVPGSWRADAEGFVSAPNGGSLSVTKLLITNWAAHKAQIRAAYVHPKIVHEDSDHRLWFEIGSEPQVQHYIAVVNGLTVCMGLLEIPSNTTPDAADTIHRIADSIGPAPDKWPPDEK